MKKLVSGEVTRMAAGNYVFSVSITSGTSVFSFAIDNINFEEVDDSSFSAKDNGQIALPSCSFKATFTGDAEAWIGKVK
jgi:spore coat protein U-like protein